MALLTTVQQAAVNALAAWLTSELTGGITVNQMWPEETVPLTRAVTILRAGPPVDVLFDPIVELEEDTDPPDPTKVKITVSYKARQQRLQLDIWDTTDVGRDDIAAQLENALNTGDAATVGYLHSDPVRAGMLLQFLVQDGWVGTIDYEFDGCEVMDTPDSVQRSEFRGLVRGTADMKLTKTLVVNRIQRLTVRQKAPPTTLKTDIATVTKTGVTYTQT